MDGLAVDLGGGLFLEVRLFLDFFRGGLLVIRSVLEYFAPSFSGGADL